MSGGGLSLLADLTQGGIVPPQAAMRQALSPRSDGLIQQFTPHCTCIY
jgi:hypothetical protein